MASSDQTVQVSSIETPPTRIFGILQRLGPGLIIAGSIVGSGELIGTTKTGAESGFWLLWLILIGCVIKVFCQVELGRYTIISGKTTLDAFGDVPGPRVTERANWLTAYWLVMFLVSLGQLGGIVGGVGQTMQIAWPLTDAGRAFNEQSQNESQYSVLLAEQKFLNQRDAGLHQARIQEIDGRLADLGARIIAGRHATAAEQISAATEAAKRAGLEQAMRHFDARVAKFGPRPELVLDGQHPDVKAMPTEVRAALFSYGKRSSRDPELWAAIVTVITAVLLVKGRYGFVQWSSTIMVASFTAVTVVNVCLLQAHPTWAVTSSELAAGLSFRLPPAPDGGISWKAISTALATFGIIGVGANELIQYPYWCIEKGYARFTGVNDGSDSWADRARGWLRVLRWDAWCSMVVYTFATVAFYLNGAAILGRTGLNPASSDMIQTLLMMYEPVFGSWAKWVFLFGAFAVLYSTFFIAIAGHARVFPEGLQTFGIGPSNRDGYERSVRFFSGLLPFLCLSLFVLFPKQPEVLILLSGMMQGIMLPMLAGAALYFRFRRCDRRVAPTKVWDLFLWLSAVGLLITGVATIWTEIAKVWK